MSADQWQAVGIMLARGIGYSVTLVCLVVVIIWAADRWGGK